MSPLKPLVPLVVTASLLSSEVAHAAPQPLDETFYATIGYQSALEHLSPEVIHTMQELSGDLLRHGLRVVFDDSKLKSCGITEDDKKTVKRAIASDFTMTPKNPLQPKPTVDFYNLSKEGDQWQLTDSLHVTYPLSNSPQSPGTLQFPGSLKLDSLNTSDETLPTRPVTDVVLFTCGDQPSIRLSSGYTGSSDIANGAVETLPDLTDPAQRLRWNQAAIDITLDASRDHTYGAQSFTTQFTPTTDHSILRINRAAQARLRDYHFHAFLNLQSAGKISKDMPFHDFITQMPWYLLFRGYSPSP